MTDLAQPAAGRAVLSADDIDQMLPHRYPFFLLDRVTALEPGASAEAIKNITVSDPVLAGHFPGRMLYPGVLLVECLAQLAAVIYGSAGALRATGELIGNAERVGYLAEIRQAKFLRPVVPGDQVVFRAQSGPRLGEVISVTGQASVGREVVMTARLAVTEREDQ
ncbi:3-hydroxyacyl-ACP dehydratase FabZ [Streptomyces sp. NPDC054933]